MTVGELLQRVSSKEMTQWLAFYRLEPFGRYFDDYGAGVVASTIANVNRSRNSGAFKPTDFTPNWGEGDTDNTDKRQPISEMRDVLMSFVSSKPKRNKKRRGKARGR